MLSEKEFYLKVKENILQNMSEEFHTNYEVKLEEQQFGDLNEKLVYLTLESHNPATMNINAPSMVLKPIYEQVYIKKYKENFNKSIKNIALSYEKAMREAPVKNEVETEAEPEKEFNLESVFYTVTNYESNKDQLSDIAHEKVGEIAKVYRMKVGDNQNVLITNGIMEQLGSTLEEVKMAAEKNTPEFFPAEITEMKNNQFYISNQQNSYGSATMLYENGPVQELAERLDKDILIIPASKHGYVAEGVDGKDVNGLLFNMYSNGMDANSKIADTVILFDKEAKKLIFDKDEILPNEVRDINRARVR